MFESEPTVKAEGKGCYLISDEVELTIIFDVGGQEAMAVPKIKQVTLSSDSFLIETQKGERIYLDDTLRDSGSQVQPAGFEQVAWHWLRCAALGSDDDRRRQRVSVGLAPVPGRRRRIAVIAGDGIGPGSSSKRCVSSDRSGFRSGSSISHGPRITTYRRKRRCPRARSSSCAISLMRFFGALGDPRVPRRSRRSRC